MTRCSGSRLAFLFARSLACIRRFGGSDGNKLLFRVITPSGSLSAPSLVYSRGGSKNGGMLSGRKLYQKVILGALLQFVSMFSMSWFCRPSVAAKSGMCKLNPSLLMPLVWSLSIHIHDGVLVPSPKIKLLGYQSALPHFLAKSPVQPQFTPLPDTETIETQMASFSMATSER